MVDRWTCAPARGGFVRPPLPAVAAAAAGAAVFGVAAALTGAGALAIAAAAALVGAAQAVPLALDFAPFTSYPERISRLAPAIAVALVAVIWTLERATGRRLHRVTRLVGLFTAVVLYLKLLALLHPSKPPVDAIFHAHRLQWVLEGRLFFTQPMPSGVRFPYAIGLYVIAAPFTWFTPDYVLLLNVLVTAAEALGGLLLYLMIVRIWSDRLAGALAALLFPMVPRTFEIVGNANMTNAFAQSVALMTVAAAVLWPLEWRRWRQIAALTLLAALALLSHISTFALLTIILAGLGALYWSAHAGLRQAALSIWTASALAAVLSVGLYYGHFGDAYRSAARVRAAQKAGPSTVAPEPAGLTAEHRPRPDGGDTTRLPSKAFEAARLTVAAIGWPIFVLTFPGIAASWTRGWRDRLSLAVLAWALTALVFISGVILMPVELSFQRYAAEFITRVTLATYPAALILAGLGAASGWRAGRGWRVATAAAVGLAVLGGVRSWLGWVL
jgi:hypothetical protein